MKKLLSLLLAMAMAISLTACGGTERQGGSAPSPAADPVSGQETETPDIKGETEPPAAEDTEGTKILVAYFSWADNAILADDVDAVASPSVIPPGNVQQLAVWVQEETGGDLFAIRVTDPYPSDWDACLERANEERGSDARPELEEQVEDMDQYDTVFLGYPNWWYGVPMALLSFLEQNDLSGKDVYLFCSHGTGGLARSVEIITEAAPDANISDRIFDCYEEEAASSEEDIKAWVDELGFSAGDSVENEQAARQITAERWSMSSTTAPPRTPFWRSSLSPSTWRTTAPTRRSSTRPRRWIPRLPPWRRAGPVCWHTTPPGVTW